MTNHLLLKFHFSWETSNGTVNTISEHQAIIKQHGACWWGRPSSISQIKADQLKAQLDSGTETWVFLYSIWVPKNVHPDKTLWYFARLKGISLERPSNIELIPQYYRDKNLDCYFLLNDIKPIEYDSGFTPKVPGQAALRHITLAGAPNPKNIRFVSDERKSESIPVQNLDDSEPTTISIENQDFEDLKSRIIDLQADIIRLQDHVAELKTYKDYYQKILNTDYLFSSEKFFESWLHENMHKILPGIDIIDRQPSAKWSDGKFGRLDLIAVNKETKEICIIEVKTRKRSKNSGYDQFVRYTSWARRSRDSIANTYATYGVKATENPSFIIISDYIDEEMTAICKDHQITLIHVFGGLGFEKVT